MWDGGPGREIAQSENGLHTTNNLCRAVARLSPTTDPRHPWHCPKYVRHPEPRTAGDHYQERGILAGRPAELQAQGYLERNLAISGNRFVSHRQHRRPGVGLCDHRANQHRVPSVSYTRGITGLERAPGFSVLGLDERPDCPSQRKPSSRVE